MVLTDYKDRKIEIGERVRIEQDTPSVNGMLYKGSIVKIDEYNKITVTREIHISLLRTILLHWDEYEFQLTKGDI